jgi:hypothetical protein
MKKLLLSLFLSGTAVYAGAQCSTSGKTDGAIYDDFSSATVPAGLTYSANPAIASITRDAANSELDLVVSQAQGDYQAVQISFGKDPVTDKTNTIDLSSDATYDLTITNDDPSVTINLGLSILDTNGNYLNVDPKYNDADPTPAFEAWNFPINLILSPGESKTMTAGTQAGAGILSGTFTDAARANWSNSTYETSFDFTAVGTINLIFINNDNTGDPLYQPYTIVDVPIRISDIRIGNCSAVSGLLSRSTNKNKINVIPNPASDLVKISYTAEEGAVLIHVTDVLGNMVKTIEGTSTEAQINVSDLNQGVYLLSIESSEGAFVSSQKLIVE